MTTETLKSTLFVIFGCKGDLTWRKLIPALFDLYLDEKMPPRFYIIGIDFAKTNLEQLTQHMHEGVKKFARHKKTKNEDWTKFIENFVYLAGDFESADTYLNLGRQCEKLTKSWDKDTNYIFYLATPPTMFDVIPKCLHQANLLNDPEHTRLVIEKPLGHDLLSAQNLNLQLAKYLDEKQIFRIDHYLGKETVQNILAMRFANPQFEPIWNRHYIEFVAITVAEEVGVGHRGGYYEHAGALRDMVQNHLMQLLCLIALEPILSFDADEIRNKKIDVLHAIRKIRPESVHQYAVRGQYAEGQINGKNVKGYREEPGIQAHSHTETFVALKWYVDNWRWQGVPFYMRTGKRLPYQTSEIVIQFRAIPHQAFPPEAILDWQPARLILSIQPEEEIVMRFQAKHPGQQMHLRTVEMQFNYQDAFTTKSADAYETLLLDVMRNDPTLFMRADQVETAWNLCMPILDLWKASPPVDFPNYKAGTWGPEVADALLAQEGHSWPLPLIAESKSKYKQRKSC